MTAMAPPRIQTVTGAALRPFIPALARLRITVFRDWPYLYEGDQTYEESYLRIYADSPRAAIVLAFDGEAVVGASTCLPLADETANVQAPFQSVGIGVARVFYFGESILLRAYRGTGAGVRFFAEREAHARRSSACDIAAFCAVQRSPDHPARPADAVPTPSGGSAASRPIRASPATCTGRRSVPRRKARTGCPSGSRA
jgi:hypothetical protein